MVLRGNLAEEGGPGYSEEQVEAFAAQFIVDGGYDEFGEPVERPATPADFWPSPFDNYQQAASANGGKAPPDLSVMAKARTYERGFPWWITDVFTQYNENGVDYMAAFLQGYTEPPEDFDYSLGNWNEYYPGNQIGMPPILMDGIVEYADGTEATEEQMAHDVSVFLTWSAEPHLEARKEMGVKVILFLIVFAGMMYAVKRKVWSDIPHS